MSIFSKHEMKRISACGTSDIITGDIIKSHDKQMLNIDRKHKISRILMRVRLILTLLGLQKNLMCNSFQI